MKIRFKELLSRKEFIAVSIFFLGILAYFYFTFFTPNYYDGKSPKKFEIAKGETFNEVVNRLYGEGIIPSKIDMRIAGFIYGAGKKIRAARYQIPNGLSYLDLLNLFIYGDAEFMRTVIVRDGLSIGWMAYVLKKDALIDSTDFVKLAFNTNFVDSLGIRKSSLEGYLLTGEYEIYEKSPAQEVILKMFNEFQKFMNDTLKARTAKLGLNVHEVITLASIIKGETNLPDEMPKISGVYYNRLRIGMKLQADPTVQYLLKGGWRRLLHKDLLLNSRYNTYKFAGLPPGPINNPGRAAILAALYPENHNYLFFVADGKGGHKFSSSYKDHLKKVNEYRRWLKSQSK
jgi:UPF0755 protein